RPSLAGRRRPTLNPPSRAACTNSDMHSSWPSSGLHEARSVLGEWSRLALHRLAVMTEPRGARRYGGRAAHGQTSAAAHPLSGVREAGSGRRRPRLRLLGVAFDGLPPPQVNRDHPPPTHPLASEGATTLRHHAADPTA